MRSVGHSRMQEYDRRAAALKAAAVVAAKREGEPEWPTTERNGYEKFVERGRIAYLRHLEALNASSPCVPAPAEAAA